MPGLTEGSKRIGKNLAAAFAALNRQLEEDHHVGRITEKTFMDIERQLKSVNTLIVNLTNSVVLDTITLQHLGLNTSSGIPDLQTKIDSYGAIDTSNDTDHTKRDALLVQIYSLALNAQLDWLKGDCKYHIPTSKAAQIMIGLAIVVAMGVFCYFTFGLGLIPAIAGLGFIGTLGIAGAAGVTGFVAGGVAVNATFSEYKARRKAQKLSDNVLSFSNELYNAENAVSEETVPSSSCRSGF